MHHLYVSFNLVFLVSLFRSQVQVLFDARADLHSGRQLTPLQLCAAHASLTTLRKLLETLGEMDRDGLDSDG